MTISNVPDLGSTTSEKMRLQLARGHFGMQFVLAMMRRSHKPSKEAGSAWRRAQPF